MDSALVPGITKSLSLEVNDRLRVTASTPDFSGPTHLPPVFATTFMVGFMEWACIEALKPHLLDGQNTVGTHIYLNHVAPGPAVMKMTAHVELIEVKGSTLRFRVHCYDGHDLIGSGFHERLVIGTLRLMSRKTEKAQRINIRTA